jgi:hypothetical protein
VSGPRQVPGLATRPTPLGIESLAAAQTPGGAAEQADTPTLVYCPLIG